MKHLREVLQAVSPRKRLRDLSIEEEDLLNAVIERSRREQLRLCTLLALAVGCLIFLVSLAIFLIHDVVLYRNDIAVSRTGALMPRKACQCEQALYLFNTSQLWADTGITLNEGDRVKISVSGAFHSSLPQLVRAARENRRPPYAWLDASAADEQRFVDTDSLREEPGGGAGTGRQPSVVAGSEECIVPEARFGAILYQIVPDAEPCSSDHTAAGFAERVQVLSPDQGREFRPVTRSGTLYLAVNDIYLNDSIIERHERANRLAAQRFFERHAMAHDGDTTLLETPLAATTSATTARSGSATTSDRSPSRSTSAAASASTATRSGTAASRRSWRPPSTNGTTSPSYGPSDGGCCSWPNSSSPFRCSSSHSRPSPQCSSTPYRLCCCGSSEASWLCRSASCTGSSSAGSAAGAVRAPQMNEMALDFFRKNFLSSQNDNCHLA